MRSTLEERLHCKSQRKEDSYGGRSNYPWIRWIRPDGALCELEAHRSPGSTPAGLAAFFRERILSRRSCQRAATRASTVEEWLQKLGRE